MGNEAMGEDGYPVASKARYGVDRFVEVDGFLLHYVEAGEGEATVLVPGSFSTYRCWNRIMPLLSGHFRLLALDYLGVGDSDKPGSGFRYTIREQADLIARMVEKLGLPRVNLVGASYGGAIVLNLAARYPGLVGKVVSIEGGVIIPDRLPGSPIEYLLKYPLVGDLFIALARTSPVRGLILRLVAGRWYPRMTADDRRELLDDLYHNARTATRVAWYWISASHKAAESFEEAAKAMQAPVLYLYGTQSDFLEDLVDMNLGFFETYMPNVTVVGLEGGVHDLAVQKPREVADLIAEFFRSGGS